MLKAAKMYMNLLTSMLKLNALKVTTNTMQKDMIYRLAVFSLFISMLSKLYSFVPFHILVLENVE